MSRKYIGRQNVNNFIYPNNVLSQYGVEIIHDINNNSVSGSTSNFTGTSVSSTGMTFQFDYIMTTNGAETFVRENGDESVLSVHMMTANQLYFKPWRLVDDVHASSGSTIYTGTTSFSVTPSQFGLSSFSNGDYYFEIRFIGKRAIYPVCRTYTVSGITPPTPTPTPTPTITPTNNPTPTPSPTAGNIYTSGATLNVTDPGWIKYDTSSGTTYQFINSTGTVTLTNCLICSTINFGFPFADLANFTVTSCGTICGGPPPPTPTPSASPGPISYVYYILTDCQTYETKYSQQFVDGTFSSGDRVEGSAGYYYVVSGYVVSTPITQTYVYATGQFGCP